MEIVGCDDLLLNDDGMQVQENWAADGFVNMVGADAV